MRSFKLAIIVFAAIHHIRLLVSLPVLFQFVLTSETSAADLTLEWLLHSVDTPHVRGQCVPISGHILTPGPITGQVLNDTAFLSPLLPFGRRVRDNKRITGHRCALDVYIRVLVFVAVVRLVFRVVKHRVFDGVIVAILVVPIIEWFAVLDVSHNKFFDIHLSADRLLSHLMSDLIILFEGLLIVVLQVFQNIKHKLVFNRSAVICVVIKDNKHFPILFQ